MARIRTIKPEFWTSEQVMDCSTNARLLFIGLWNFCDDAGRMAASARRIKASVFPSDDFSSDDVRRMIDELSANGLLHLYVVDGIEYLCVTGWRHQKIDKPQTSKLPPPPDPTSPNGRRTFGVGREGNGEEGKGRERKNLGPAAEPHPTLQVAQPASEPVDDTAKAAAAPARNWQSRENFNRIEARCVAALDKQAPADAVIGPMVFLVERDGYDLENEVVPALLDMSAGRTKPIKTWSLWAKIVRERVDEQRGLRAMQGLPEVPAATGEMHDMGPFGVVADAVLRKAIKHHREAGKWFADIFGPAPGQPGCRVPAKLLLEAA